MKTNNSPISFTRLMTAVTQEPGDPTFSVLKAHLVFEELLRAYLDRELLNPKALEGARLTFAQILAVTRACSPASDITWHWEAMAKLNSIRNMLSHNLLPAERDGRIADFVSFVTKSNGIPMPPPTITHGEPVAPGRFFLEIDMATGALFGFTAGKLGFDVDFDAVEELSQSGA
jgi:hypothetical protein